MYDILLLKLSYQIGHERVKIQSWVTTALNISFHHLDHGGKMLKTNS